MRRHISRAVVVLAVGAIVAACSDSGTDPTSAPDDNGGGADAEITIAEFAFSGPESVGVGDTVEVTNNDSVGHTWTAAGGEFDSGTLNSGDSFEFTFEEAGDFDFSCSIHPNMTGSITVEG
jgi:plastocyanin